jgi:uncharacterized protein
MHPSRNLVIAVSPSIGEVSAIIIQPEKLKAVLVLAHGAGAGMAHPFMESLATSLAGLGVGTLRFNFPYMEAQKRRPDPPAIAEKTVATVIGRALNLFPDVTLFAGGKSFGGRMTSQRLAKEPADQVKGIVFFGFPLHPAGSPSTERAAHLESVQVPMLFLQGTRDTLAEIQLLQKVCKSLSRAALITFEGADHSFKVKGRNLIPELASATADWMEKITS